MLTAAITPDAWLNLGVPGAALFIVLIVVLQMFKQQSKSVDKLCYKIDNLLDSFSNNNVELTKISNNNDRDQKETLKKLTSIEKDMKDIRDKTIELQLTCKGSE